jgi:SAM-dependent methyltransferase
MRAIVKLVSKSFRDRHRATWNKGKFVLRNAYGKLVRTVWRPPLPSPEHGVNLHLGCGRIDHPHFINVDGSYFPHVHYIRGLHKLSPFETGTVDLIYASHCLEHYSYLDTEGVLAEWYRTLKPGGSLRLSVPDFDVLARAFQESGYNIDAVEAYVLGGHGNKYNIHLALFNFERLSARLRAVGFREVRRWTPNQDQFSSMDDASRTMIRINDRDLLLSLNIEGIK